MRWSFLEEKLIVFNPSIDFAAQNTSADALVCYSDLRRAHPEFIEGSKRENELWRDFAERMDL